MVDFTTMQKDATTSWETLNFGDKPLITIGNATCGRSAGSIEVMDAIRAEAAQHGIECNIIEVGCIGLCYMEPIVSIKKPGQPAVVFGNVTLKQVKGLVQNYLVHDELPTKLVLGTYGEGQINDVPKLFELPVLKPQVRRALKRVGFIDPTDLDHYMAHGGYTGLTRAFDIGPERIVEEIKHAGLRGRGGAGFPTWRKWSFCRGAESDQKYLICNADEGDPGAFMNRSLIEGDPHALIEGMIIAGYALGATIGYIYCRAEYPLALERLGLAIHQAEEIGLLGDRFYFRMYADGSDKRLHDTQSEDPRADSSAQHPDEAARLAELTQAYYETAKYLRHHNGHEELRHKTSTQEASIK